MACRMVGSARLVRHTLIAVMLALCFVLAPVILMIEEFTGLLGQVSQTVALILFSMGSAAILCALLTRVIDGDIVSGFQWRTIMTGAWLLNPVLVVWCAVAVGQNTLSHWSGMPFACLVAAVTARHRLADGDYDWQTERCPPRPHVLVAWVCSRAVVVLLPAFILCLQVTLYIPKVTMLPQDGEVGLVVCGGCILISAKFCAMCAALARQSVAQAFIFVLLLSADWISSLNLLQLVDMNYKIKLLLSHLTVIGVVLVHATGKRLRLRFRWNRAVVAARTSRAEGEGGARELEAGGGRSVILSGGVVQSDSDDEAGNDNPIPDGFHEALLTVLGGAPFRDSPQARRRFLCAARQALVRTGSHDTPLVDAEGGGLGGAVTPLPKPPALSVDAPQPTSDSLLQSKPPLALEIGADERICTVCQDEIKTGEKVRPMPKCSHVFHQSCIDRWAKQMREATGCPTCRRPALARKALEGSVSISVLTGDDGETASASTPSSDSETSGRRSRGARSRETPPPANRRDYSGTPQLATLRSSLHISEALACAALQNSRGSTDAAAHVLLEHRGVLEAHYHTDPPPPRFGRRAQIDPPVGALEAMVQANPALEGAEEMLKRQLARLRAGSLAATPWAELSAQGKLELLRSVLEDVSTRLEAAS